jgi:hypothetical protein
MITKIKKGTSSKEIRRILAKQKHPKGINAFKHCGVIRLRKDPLDIQKELRNEWN